MTGLIRLCGTRSAKDSEYEKTDDHCIQASVQPIPLTRWGWFFQAEALLPGILGKVSHQLLKNRRNCVMLPDQVRLYPLSQKAREDQ